MSRRGGAYARERRGSYAGEEGLIGRRGGAHERKRRGSNLAARNPGSSAQCARDSTKRTVATPPLRALARVALPAGAKRAAAAREQRAACFVLFMEKDPAKRQVCEESSE